MNYYTEYMNHVTHPDYPWAFTNDSEENIMNHLNQYTLDPVFERYGDFVNMNPEWISDAAAEKYKGCAMISGNFLTFSHAFRLVTNDPNLISRLSAAIDANKSTQEYKDAKARMIARENEEIERRRKLIEKRGTYLA